MKTMGPRQKKRITVHNSLSEDVLIYVTVTVPEDTPKEDPIVYHFFRDQYLVLAPCGNGRYNGLIGVPRGWRFDGHFTRCIENRDKKRECTLNGEQVDRRVIAEKELHLDYVVEKWQE